ncbi:MAG: hypothetical protein JWN14_3764, partial [Chthonomonadales bacterium]|nr:hypothetical protein [Chthonomonadales bacterium]
MLLLGEIVTAFAILITLFKLSVVWDVSRDPYGGGGVWTTDFVIFYPGWIALGIDILLGASHKIPFRNFGGVLYIVLVAIFLGVYVLIFATGDRKLAREREQERAAEIKESVRL